MTDTENPLPPPEPPTPAVAAPGVPPARSAWRNPWLIIALLALALAAWQWIETRARIADTQQELTRRLADSDTLGKESRILAKQAQEQVAALQGKIGELEGKLTEAKGQQASLEALYQDLARSREDWALAEVEQGVTLAAQQLQLAANVQGAVLALQSADARLAGSTRPQFIAVRKALAHDLERLRALPQVDLPGMNVRLESVLAAVDTLPLAIDARLSDDGKPAAARVAAPAPVASLAFWRTLGGEFWNELRGLLRIQRFDRNEPALLAPGQLFFLRENLKLRLLNARLALLAHDQATFRSELRQAQAWVDRYFDNRDQAVQTAQASLRQLLATEISGEVPNLNESLAAIRNFKPGKERK
jgi:uroporphyrin-3 C-methyltransferase